MLKTTYYFVIHGHNAGRLHMECDDNMFTELHKCSHINVAGSVSGSIANAVLSAVDGPGKII